MARQARKRALLRMLTPHPSRPGSMVALVALPASLILLTLVSVPVRMFPVEPYLPIFDPLEDDASLPKQPRERVVVLAGRVGVGTTEERGRSLLALALWTDRCPAYAPYTVPRLAAGLEDADPVVRGATAFALGALGAHASEALPLLRAARGRGDAHYDHIVAEAIWWIEHGRARPQSEECEPLSAAGVELQRPATE